MDIPLNPDIEKLVSRQIQSGRFRTPAEVIRSAVLLLAERELLGAGNPDNESEASSSRRSPRGILADIRSYISPDDIQEARAEMWASFSHGEG